MREEHRRLPRSRPSGTVSRITEETKHTTMPPPWRRIKRQRQRHSWQCPIDFVFENPLDGCFKSSKSIEWLVSDNPGKVYQIKTSYCNYETLYRKRTVFFTSLSGFNLLPPCPTWPCKNSESHETNTKELSIAEKNSIPSKLVSEMIEAWTGTWVRADTGNGDAYESPYVCSLLAFKL